jgi:hypothetical protein
MMLTDSIYKPYKTCCDLLQIINKETKETKERKSIFWWKAMNLLKNVIEVNA